LAANINNTEIQFFSSSFNFRKLAAIIVLLKWSYLAVHSIWLTVQHHLCIISAQKVWSPGNKCRQSIMKAYCSCQLLHS